jgi:hypothetical protein
VQSVEKSTSVSGEHTASIFRNKKYAKDETSIKAGNVFKN